jgi:hypothetical protein
MPAELMELYNLYQQELTTRHVEGGEEMEEWERKGRWRGLSTRHNEKEATFLSDLNTMLRSPSMLSLRGPELEERPDRLPPIRQDQVHAALGVVFDGSRFVWPWWKRSHQDGEALFQRPERRDSYPRGDSRLSLNTPERSVALNMVESRLGIVVVPVFEFAEDSVKGQRRIGVAARSAHHRPARLHTSGGTGWNTEEEEEK